MTTSTVMPAVFIGHGSPMDAVDDTRHITDDGAALPRPELAPPEHSNL